MNRALYDRRDERSLRDEQLDRRICVSPTPPPSPSCTRASTTSSILCTPSVPSFTGTSARAWRRASSPRCALPPPLPPQCPAPLSPRPYVSRGMAGPRGPGRAREGLRGGRRRVGRGRGRGGGRGVLDFFTPILTAAALR